MKKIALITALALVLALLSQFAFAEPASAVQGVFDALTAVDSDYSQTKAMYAEYFDGVQWEEAVEGDSIVIGIDNSEYMDGSWTFTQDGDYLTGTFGGEDIMGLTLTMEVIKAVGSYLGMEDDVMTGYVNGLTYLGIESDDFAMAEDESDGAITVRINDVAPWDMRELDQMVLDERIVEPMEEGYTSTSANIGKLMMVANGDSDDMTILLGEFGGLDEMAYQSIVNVVDILKPAGFEDFAANYTELADAETDAYTAWLNVGMDEVGEIIYDAKDSYSYAILRFGGSGEDYDGEYEVYDDVPPEPMEAPSVEALAEGYFGVILDADADVAARAASVCRFAMDYELWNPDVEPLRANLLAAFEGLDVDAQDAFWTAFDEVRALLDDSLEDYDATRAAFEDAGVAETLDETMYDPLNREAWQKLRDHTLTMGNDENVG